jgi:hypothetical protein
MCVVLLEGVSQTDSSLLLCRPMSTTPLLSRARIPRLVLSTSSSTLCVLAVVSASQHLTDALSTTNVEEQRY